MNRTSTAIAALMALTVDNDRGPAWVKLLGSIIQLACVVYLAWYVIFGPEPVERKQPRR